MEYRVYIANLGKYNEGYLVGGWFDLPVDAEEMKGKIGLNELYEEYAIHDYELPFPVGEYTSIAEINDLYEKIEKLPDYVQENLSELTDYMTIDEVIENADSLVFYPGITNMVDFAYYLVDELGLLNDVPDVVRLYFDYETYARDLEIESRLIVTDNGIFEVI